MECTTEIEPAAPPMVNSLLSKTSLGAADHTSLDRLSIDKAASELPQNDVPVSDSAVDSFLATVVIPDRSCASTVDESAVKLESSSTLEVTSPIPANDTSSGAIEECRKLLLPQITDNAWRRNPDVDDAALRRHVRTVLTDDWCEEMLEHARRVRAEMRSRGVYTSQRGLEYTQGDEDQKVEQVELIRGNEEDRPDWFLEAENDAPQIESASTPVFTSSDSPMLNSTVRAVERLLGPGETGTSNVYSHPGFSKNTDENTCAGTASQDIHVSSYLLPHVVSEHTFADMSAHSTTDSDHLTRPHETIKQEEDPKLPINGMAVDRLSSDVANRPESRQRRGSTPISLTTTGPSSHVPELWSITTGSNIPSVKHVHFFIEEDVNASVQRWTRRHRTFDDRANYISVHFTCLPAAALAGISQNLSPDASFAKLSAALRDIPTTWPPMGTLIVDVNPRESGAMRTFLPTDLIRSNGPLELTAFVQPGSNTIRLIQLRNTSDFVFVLYAMSPSLEERRRYALMSVDGRDWTSFLTSASSNTFGLHCAASPPTFRSESVESIG